MPKLPTNTNQTSSIPRFVTDNQLYRAVRLFESGSFREAREACAGILRQAPHHPQAVALFGTILARLGETEAALPVFDLSVQLDPSRADIWLNRGLALVQLRRVEEGVASYSHAIKLQPNLVEAHAYRANALTRLGRFREALAGYRTASALRPNDPSILGSQARAMQRSGDGVGALATCERALALMPNDPDNWANKGVLLVQITGDVQAGNACFEQAIALRPDHLDAWINKGLLLQRFTGDLQAAMECFGHALRIQPDHPRAQLYMGVLLLQLGDFARGWPLYERRWDVLQPFEKAYKPEGRLWLGQEPVAGKTVLLHAEQGLGDTIQFCRYAEAVAAMGARVVLVVQRPLVRLLKSLAGCDLVVAQGDPLPNYDWCCPLMSLPLACRDMVEAIPAKIPYLWADAVASAEFARALPPSAGRRVGLVWAGGEKTGNPDAMESDERRSITLDMLGPLSSVSGCDFVSVQIGRPGKQARHPPANMRIHDPTGNIHDFADTASLLSNLDLTISVDTSTAHLAGAMGRPVWLLNRFDTDWRWFWSRDDSPWYPTMRLFRQSQPGDWGDVIERTRSALQVWAAAQPG